MMVRRHVIININRRHSLVALYDLDASHLHEIAIKIQPPNPNPNNTSNLRLGGRPPRGSLRSSVHAILLFYVI